MGHASTKTRSNEYHKATSFSCTGLDGDSEAEEELTSQSKEASEETENDEGASLLYCDEILSEEAKETDESGDDEETGLQKLRAKRPKAQDERMKKCETLKLLLKKHFGKWAFVIDKAWPTSPLHAFLYFNFSGSLWYTIHRVYMLDRCSSFCGEVLPTPAACAFDVLLIFLFANMTLSMFKLLLFFVSDTDAKFAELQQEFVRETIQVKQSLAKADAVILNLHGLAADLLTEVFKRHFINYKKIMQFTRRTTRDHSKVREVRKKILKQLAGAFEPHHQCEIERLLGRDEGASESDEVVYAIRNSKPEQSDGSVFPSACSFASCGNGTSKDAEIKWNVTGKLGMDFEVSSEFEPKWKGATDLSFFLKSKTRILQLVLDYEPEANPRFFAISIDCTGKEDRPPPEQIKPSTMKPGKKQVLRVWRDQGKVAASLAEDADIMPSEFVFPEEITEVGWWTKRNSINVVSLSYVKKLKAKDTDVHVVPEESIQDLQKVLKEELTQGLDYERDMWKNKMNDPYIEKLEKLEKRNSKQPSPMALFKIIDISRGENGLPRLKELDGPMKKIWWKGQKDGKGETIRYNQCVDKEQHKEQTTKGNASYFLAKQPEKKEYKPFGRRPKKCCPFKCSALKLFFWWPGGVTLNDCAHFLSSCFGIFCCNQVSSFIGTYSDVNHPGCPREIRYKAGSTTGIEIIGHDGDSNAEWKGSGKIDIDRIVVDLSSKGGPADLEGTFTGTGIRWVRNGAEAIDGPDRDDWPKINEADDGSDSQTKNRSRNSDSDSDTDADSEVFCSRCCDSKSKCNNSDGSMACSVGCWSLEIHSSEHGQILMALLVSSICFACKFHHVGYLFFHGCPKHLSSGETCWWPKVAEVLKAFFFFVYTVSTIMIICRFDELDAVFKMDLMVQTLRNKCKAFQAFDEFLWRAQDKVAHLEGINTYVLSDRADRLFREFGSAQTEEVRKKIIQDLTEIVI